MIEYLYAGREAQIAWAEKHIGGLHFRDDARTIGIARDGSIRAVTVFDTFTTNSCLVHIVSDGSRQWMTREYIMRVFAYPFLQCGFHRITCTVSENNADSLRFTRHFGWVEEGRLREDGEDGSDMIIFGMLRRDCRWLPQTLGSTGKSVPVAV